MSKLAEMLAAEKLSEQQKHIVKEIRKALNAEEHSEKTYLKTGFSASTLSFGKGACPRWWYFAFSGTPGSESVSSLSLDRMHTGTFRHAELQERLAKIGAEIEIEKEIHNVDPPMRGFVDAVIDGIPVEIKTMGATGYDYRAANFNPAAYHKMQLIIYCTILQSELGFFIYENRDSFDKKIIPMFMDEEKWEYSKYLFDWMRQVKQAFDDKQLPTYFKGKRVNSKICKECPVKETCDATGQGVVDIPLLEAPE